MGEGKSPLVKFADDTILGNQPIAQGQAAVQADLERLEEWVNRSGKKFSKDKRKALHVGRNHPLQQPRLRRSSAESHSGRQRRALVIISLTIRQNVV